LLRQGEYHVIDELCYPETAPLLLKQVQAYMNDIFPGFRMDIQPIIGTNNATLQFATNAAVGFVRPQNIGFGLSFTLPIYTACLCAGKGDIVMVENPEAHLHPFAQSQIGDFIAKTASAGVQVIVETHSDHVLNGIRKSVKNEAHPIKASDTAVYFFSGLKEEGDPMIISTEIKDDGSLTEWPDGFFNQYEKDLAELVEW
jgi:predicted ATPase